MVFSNLVVMLILVWDNWIVIKCGRKWADFNLVTANAVHKYRLIDAGFILIAVGVVTLEMRDMSSKVCPLSTKRPLAANVPAKAKFTPELLIEMFQTPSMRIVQELARKASRVRTISCQTRHYYRNVNTSNRNVIFRSWDCIYVRHKDRRCCVYKRRHKQVQSKHLVNCKAKFSLAFSCPALATIS